MCCNTHLQFWISLASNTCYAFARFPSLMTFRMLSISLSLPYFCLDFFAADATHLFWPLQGPITMPKEFHLLREEPPPVVFRLAKAKPHHKVRRRVVNLCQCWPSTCLHTKWPVSPKHVPTITMPGPSNASGSRDGLSWAALYPVSHVHH
jgi:hypothetical protein